MFLRQSTAATVPLGPFVDDNDGKTFETALVIQKVDVKLSKSGGAYAAAGADQGSGDSGAAYMANGDYGISLNAADTGTVGRLRVNIGKTGALPVWKDFTIIAQKTYDRLFGSDQLADEVHLAKAALTNARSHAIDTGVDQIKDDDGITTLRTLTPDEALGVVTITPS
jgi:hypothetical protein